MNRRPDGALPPRGIPAGQDSMRFVGIFNCDGGTFRTIDVDTFVSMATAVLASRGIEL